MALPGAILYGAVFALGAAVGSFLNVCIYRLPRDRSVVAPPSHCPQCGVRLRAVDLVPLLSFLALGRKCRRCGGPIAWRYFGVELLTAVVFLLVWQACGGGPQVIACAIFAAVVIAVVFIDLDHMIIPDQLVVAALGAAVLGAALSPRPGATPLEPALLPAVGGAGGAAVRLAAGGVVGLAVFVGIRGFSHLLFRREGMGLGDVKLAGAIGAMLGPATALLSFGVAVALGAAVGLALMAARVRRRMEYLPFGPFLASAALAALLAPEPLWGAAREAYGRWVGLLGL